MVSYHSEYSNLDLQCLTFTHTDKAHDILPFWAQQPGLPVSDIHTYWQSSWYLTILSTAIWTSSVWHSHILTKLMISYHSEHSNLDFQCLTFTHTDKAHDILPFLVQQSGLPVFDIHTCWQSSWYLTILSTAIWTSSVWHSHMLTKLMISYHS